MDACAYMAGRPARLARGEDRLGIARAPLARISIELSDTSDLRFGLGKGPSLSEGLGWHWLREAEDGVIVWLSDA